MVLEHAEASGTDFLIYTGHFCGYCRALKNLLDRKELTYTEYNFDEHDGMRMAVVQVTGHRTVPVVFDLARGTADVHRWVRRDQPLPQEKVVSHSLSAS